MFRKRRPTRRRRASRPTDGLGWLLGGLWRLLLLPFRLVAFLVAALLRGVVAFARLAFGGSETASSGQRAPPAGQVAAWLALSPTQFEEAVARLLRAQGYRDVRRVGGAGDLGVDILARDPDGRLTAVQCKRYAPGSRIGSKEIQTFIGMVFVHHRAERAIFVTTSDFTPQARALAHRHAIQLIDGAALARLRETSSGPRSFSWRLAAGAVAAGLLLCLVAAVVGELDDRAAPASPTPRPTLSPRATATAVPTPRPTRTPIPRPTRSLGPARPLAPTIAPVAALSEAASGPHLPPAAEPAPNPPGIPAPAVRSAIVSVVDGDTIYVLLDSRAEPVRFVGIDAPETHHPTAPAECFGPEATARLVALLPVGEPVYLERDVTDRDQYDRLLRHVWLPAAGSDAPTLVAELLVREGYALAVIYPPDRRYADRLAAAEQAARAADLGLWEACDGSAPPAPAAPVAAGCDPSYPDVCIPPPPPDLDCPQVPFAGFRVVGADPHRFDRERDGIGCE